MCDEGATSSSHLMYYFRSIYCLLSMIRVTDLFIQHVMLVHDIIFMFAFCSFFCTVYTHSLTWV